MPATARDLRTDFGWRLARRGHGPVFDSLRQRQYFYLVDTVDKLFDIPPMTRQFAPKIAEQAGSGNRELHFSPTG